VLITPPRSPRHGVPAIAEGNPSLSAVTKAFSADWTGGLPRAIHPSRVDWSRIGATVYRCYLIRRDERDDGTCQGWAITATPPYGPRLTVEAHVVYPNLTPGGEPPPEH